MRKGNTSAGGIRAVFLDRDGVLTENIWNPATNAYESPHTLADLALCADIYAPLQALTAAGFALFIVSNQPSYAKGKTSLENIQAIAEAVEVDFRAHGVTFRQTYYCYHHPLSIVPEYSGPCACRKPSPYFLYQAAAHYGVELAQSWMIGDRGSDIECGQRAGSHTVLVTPPHAELYTSTVRPDHIALNLAAGTKLILEARNEIASSLASRDLVPGKIDLREEKLQ